MSEAMLNDPSAALSKTRRPRFRVLANGDVLQGGIELEVENNNHYSSDHFSAQVSLSASGAKPLSFWGGTDSITIEIQAGFDGDSGAALPTVFVGEVDTVESDPISGLVHISGRDLSRRLIDTKTQATYQNMTSSEIAEKLAAKHGLATTDTQGNPTIKKTTNLVDRYYLEDHDHFSNDVFSKTMTDWDLMTYLAQFEGFDVFLVGRELHFQPPPADSAPPYVVRIDSTGSVPVMNAISLHLTRSLTLAADIEVWVRSWSPHRKSGFTKKAYGKVSSGSNREAPVIPKRVVIVRPNLTEEAALQLAQSTRADLTQHERVIEFDLPGDARPTARDRILLQGTDSSFDQTYFVASVTRRIGWQSGYVMSVKAKNTSPANQTIPA